MEKNQQDQDRMGNPDGQNKKANAQNDPEIHVDSTRLSDYPDGNIDDENQDATQSPPNPEGKTVDEATDPSKLSDI